MIKSSNEGSARTPSATRARTSRDGRIDFFRGVALLCIFIDHIPGNFLSRATLHNMGFSDAAELFVLLAGVSSGLAYGGRADRNRLIVARVSRIYLAHVGLVLFIAALLAASAAALGQATLLSHPAVAPFITDLPRAVGQTLTLTLQPEYIDILPLYLLLLLWLPVLLHIVRRSRRLALALAIAIWALAATFEVNLAGPRNGGWFFNPFAWQLIFSIGVIIGSQPTGEAFEHRLPRSRLVFVAAAALLLFSLLLSAPWTQLPVGAWREFRILPADLVGSVSKTYASPWRIAHVLSLAYVTAFLMPRDAQWLQGRAAMSIRALGRRPLTMFILASASSHIAAVSFVHFGKGMIVQLARNLVGLSLLTVIGNALAHAGKRRTRPAPEPHGACGAYRPRSGVAAT